LVSWLAYISSGRNTCKNSRPVWSYGLWVMKSTLKIKIRAFCLAY
jgi:hypothetical protein